MVTGQLEPGRDVRVVIQARDDDLVAALKIAPSGPREREVQCRHVGAEPDLVWAGPEEPRRSLVRRRHDVVASVARLERSSQVGIRLAQIRGHRLDHGVGHLRPAGPVEERGRPRQGRKARADGGDVEGDGTHKSVTLAQFVKIA